MSGAQNAALALGATNPLGKSYGPGMVTNVVSSIDEEEKKKEAAQKPVYDRMQKQVTDDQSRIDKMAADYTPLKQEPQPKPPANDPLSAFASPAGVFAMIASVFTHTPAIAAMNGMAGAINGAKQNNWDAYESGYKAWKDNTEIAIKNHELQAADMKAAMEKMQTDLATGVAMAKAVAAQSEDRIATKLLEEGQYQKLDETMRARASAAASMQEASLRIEQLHDQLMEEKPRMLAAKALSDAMQSGDPAKIQAARDAYAFAKNPTSSGEQPGSDAYNMRVITNDYMAHGKTQAEAIILAKKDLESTKAAAKPIANKWTLYTDSDGTQFLQQVGVDGTVKNQTINGQPYTPKNAMQMGKEDAPNVAVVKKADEQRKAKADAEKARHDAALEAITNNRNISEQQRNSQRDAETARHNKAIEVEGEERIGVAKTEEQRKQDADKARAKSQSGVGLSQDEKDAAAGMIATGMPVSQAIPGYGPNAVQERRDARAAAVKQIQEQTGLSPELAGVELANRTVEYSAGRRSATQLTTMQGATKQAVDQLDFNIKKTKEEMAKVGSSDISPVVNAIARGEEKWAGNPAYSSLFYYMHATALESARILAGGQASVAQLHQGAMDEAQKWASINMTPASFDSVAQAMIDEGRNRLDTFADALKYQRLTGSGQQKQPSSVAAPDAGRGPVENQTAISKSGQLMIFKNGEWQLP